MFPEVDPVLGPEMRSTGEVLGLAGNFGEAFFKAQEATQTVLPLSGTVLITVNNRDKEEAVDVAREFERAGFSIVATAGTWAWAEARGANIPYAFGEKGRRRRTFSTRCGEAVAPLRFF